jgi:crotonobetainyl-CoA:carnitine CoA-transferase CaiB-like acyl-CoA transferase
MPGPLDGVRVLELTQIVAGPFAGVNLADLGADVVKIEPPEGDGTRVIGQFAPGESKAFHVLNRGKRSIVLDMKRPEAQELVHRIIPEFDVFLANARAGVAERLCVDYETLRKFRPDLIYVESTGFGSSGPSAQRSGSDIVAQAYSGLMAGEAKLDEFGAPQSISCSAVADYATSLAAAMGVSAALYRRAMTGEGEFIQTSLLLSALCLQSGHISQLPVSDELLKRPLLDEIEAIRARGGGYAEIIETRKNANPVGKAFRLYYTGYGVKDGALILGALTPGNREQMRRALGIADDPSADPEFNALDPAHDAAIEALGERIRTLMLTKTMDEWLEIFDREGAPVSKVHLPEDLATDPQVEAMGYLIDLEHEVTGHERMVGPIVLMQNNPTGAPRAAPPFGVHADEVLTEVGLSAGEIEELRLTGALT